jgi:hypothetical protein
MKRILLITLSLVLALVGWSTVDAEDGFYVIPAMKGKYAPVPKTGQTVSWIYGDDNTFHKGVTWPTPRFTDNSNGTVTDNLTGLIWMKEANAFGLQNWTGAVSCANGLQAGYYGLLDGSKPGDWRLPNIRELQSLVDYRYDYNSIYPALPEGHPFIHVQVNYWSSTYYRKTNDAAYKVDFSEGFVDCRTKDYYFAVWCVRGGQ